MKLLQLFSKPKIPYSIDFAYKDFIKKRKILANGWILLMLSNNFAILVHQDYEGISVARFKKVFTAKDGKFMVIDRDNNKVIYSKEGKELTKFDQFSELFLNGWYKCLDENETLALYNDKGEVISNHLRFAHVFDNGMYQMAVDVKAPSSYAQNAGLFNKDGKRLLFGNFYKKIIVLSSGWFIVDHTLYDENGNIFIEPLVERKVPHFLLYCAGIIAGTHKK